MEERISSLETDYIAFIHDVSATQSEHTRLLRSLTRDASELKARATLNELRISNLAEQMEEMREEMRLGLAQIVSMLARKEE